ncbi:hypothetical protein BDEG_21727 [Batrachochytrium dendrobatidis JEL423]|uniref:Uncharacterized protein n=1 Tax=Batrachochytrium dendrobatidis (strain JEL423) TaxID=403673 RepID=A0A177WCA9_BATDL|nr:hypothetical protein BDEG_21727 [Batrachochytrium dendrobatidis JEL423]
MGSGSNGTTASAFGSSMSAAANKLGSYVRLGKPSSMAVCKGRITETTRGTSTLD